MRAKADSSLSAKGLSTNDVTKAFKGDFVLAGVAPSPASNDSAGGSSSKQPAIYFIATINDLGAFMKVAGKLNLAKPSSPDSPSTGGFLGKLKSDYTLRDNILVISANKQLTDGYFDNPNRRNTTLISDPVRDNPFSLAIDVKAVAAYLQGMSSGDPSPKTQQLLHILNALDQVTFAGGGLKGTKVESYFELKMADPSENSLRSIFKLLH